MAIVVRDDGYRLWYEAVGEGPAVIFPARHRKEFATLGAALADRCRVVRYMPRHVVGIMAPEEEAGGPWDPTAWSRYPLDMEVADLHAVADAAGVTDFVLAGYSGMAAQAAFLAPLSDRIVGLMVGGFPLLTGGEYWLGYVEGARTALLQAGLPEKAAEHHMSVLLYQEWSTRDDRAALAALSGPKILWYGTRDGAPDCRMYQFVGGSAIARRIAEEAEELRQLGFTLIEFDGYDHIDGLASTDQVAPKLSAALAAAGW